MKALSTFTSGESPWQYCYFIQKSDDSLVASTHTPSKIALHTSLSDRRFLQKELRSADKNRLHFFDSRFFSVIKEGDACAEAEQCKASFERVQKWTWEVNIFEKEYVFIPVFRR